MVQVVYWLSFPLIAAYFVYKGWKIKATPIWALAVASFLQDNAYAKFIALGLFLSSFGDIFLELEDDYHLDLFIPGLVSFLLAHLCYIYAFRGPVQSKSYSIAMPLVVIYYGVVMSQLLPKVEVALRVPVAVYGLAISAMAFLSLNRYFTATNHNQSKLLSLLGSLSFVASDTVLAFNKFHTAIPDAKLIVMITYYLGQVLIAGSTQVGQLSKLKL